MKQRILILLGLAVLCLQSAIADSWLIVASPNGPRQVNELHGVSALSANDIWAVGSGVIGDESATATLHWNGTRWSVIPSPNVGPEVDNSLTGVAAVSSDDIWAVGTQQPTNLTDPSALILHWNGLPGRSGRM